MRAGEHGGRRIWNTVTGKGLDCGAIKSGLRVVFLMLNPWLPCRCAWQEKNGK